MNALSLFTKLYGVLRNYGMPFWVMTPLRRSVRSLANWYLPRYLAKPVEPSNLYDNSLIVSLTSFPGRINDVWQVIESLKRQTVKPSKIILWLSLEQFPSKNQIPKSLTKIEDDLFSIRLVDEDFRSHKKYLPLLVLILRLLSNLFYFQNIFLIFFCLFLHLQKIYKKHLF